MTEYMLLFALGPVQTFISQSRKARDLWLSSYLFSALMQAGMEGVRDKLIYPAQPTVLKNISDLPSKYSAIFTDVEEATAAAIQSKNTISAFWGEICQDIWEEIVKEYFPSGELDVTRTLWDEQVKPEHAFEFSWVVVEKNGSYSEWLADTQYALAMRKQLRDFSQCEEHGEKSTLSGLRSALRGNGMTREDLRKFWAQGTHKLSTRDINKDGVERLDAVALVKRYAYRSKSLWQRLGLAELEKASQSDLTRSGKASASELRTFRGSFPSTSSIATASYVERLLEASKDAAIKQAVARWAACAYQLGELMDDNIPYLSIKARDDSAILQYDGDCYFPETFHESRIKKEFRLVMPKGENGNAGTQRQRYTDKEKVEEDRARKRLADEGPKAVSSLFKLTDALDPPITRPTPYYAMIQMDGDRMGKMINSVSDQGEHRQINQALSTFSRTVVPRLVEQKYPGRLIYAGGDDVFALAPLARDVVSMGQTGTAHYVRVLDLYENKEGAGKGNKNSEENIVTVLDLVWQLQKQYGDHVRPAVVDQPQLDTGVAATSRKDLVTASTGIAIAHHYTSLSYVRRLAREAEHAAKNQYGRNALVVTVLRRSGEQTRVGCRWHYDGLSTQGFQPVELFLIFYTLFKVDILSPKCVFILLEEAPTLVGLGRDAQKSEVKRVLLRQRAREMKERFPDNDVIRVANALVDLAAAMDAVIWQGDAGEAQRLSVELHSSGRRYGLVEVLGWLLVMLFLARKDHE